MSEIRVNRIVGSERVINFVGVTSFSGTGCFGLPGGTASERPEVPREGQVRYINGDLRRSIEFYDGSDWVTIGTSP